MMKSFKKSLLIITIVLSVDLNIYTITSESIMAALECVITSISTSTSSCSNISTFDVIPYNFSAETETERLTVHTITSEDKIMGVADYHNKETGATVHSEQQLYPDNSLDNHNKIQYDFPLPYDNKVHADTPTTSDNTQQKDDIWDNILNDSAQDLRRQEAAENNIYQTPHPPKKQSKIIREQDLQKNKVYFLADFNGIPLDSELILQHAQALEDLRHSLSSPIVQARIERLITFYTYKSILSKKFKSELAFCTALKSGKILHLLNHIYKSDLRIATASFNELKTLWIRSHKNLFLVPYTLNKKEIDFISKLGIDIMTIAERFLVTRPDYIIQHTNGKSLKTIQEYRKHCTLLKQKGDQATLLKEITKLRGTVKKRSDFTGKILLATAIKTYYDPVTIALHTIAHAPSLKQSCINLNVLELTLLTQSHKQNIFNESGIRTWTIEQHGFDLLDAAHDCYKSHRDYHYTPCKQSYFSNPIQPILENIESKPLPDAYAELINLEKQIDTILEEHSINDSIVHKEHIQTSLAQDILAIAHKKYKARADHKELVASFISLDVNAETATILKNNNTYESVAHEMSNLAQRIFVNGSLCKLEFLTQVESQVNDSIDAMRIAPDHPTFIFNLSMVNHTLGDIQQIAHAVLTGTHPVLTRSSELLREGLSAFITGLDPRTQASNIGHLAYDLGAFLQKSNSALWNDPIAVLHNGMNTTCTLIDLIRFTADFTSDLTVGKLYLSPEEYKQRTDTFCAMIEPLQDVTGEQYMQFIGQLGADVLFTHGLGIAYKFLKEIDVLEKLSGSAASVALTLKKGFDTHIADNPIMVTAEGIVLKMSHGMKDFNKGHGEIINSSKTLLESVYAPIALKLEDTIKKIRSYYLINLQKDFPNFGNKDIKIAFEHILGMQLRWNDLGNFVKLSGFHHDFMGIVEKSKAFQFVNKVIKENGCYRATLIIDGIETKKTFFPQYWTPEDVVKKIYEAYYNHIKSGTPLKLEKNGKYIVQGWTSEGITIEMHITQKGLIKTAYPIVK